jgi:hypothetical protein
LEENFDRFNSKFTRRRKEMVNFRRVVTVLAVLAMFTGLAFAQQSESCNAQGTVSTPLRAEGFTEQTGDIIIVCTGGPTLAIGANIPLVNITVFYTTAVTSRILDDKNPNNANQYKSEALLLIDEPNTGLGGTIGTGIGDVQYGQTVGLMPCLNSFQGCIETVGGSVTGFSTSVPGYNVYQGLTAGNSVTFYGIPALPPGTVGSRIYRITNVRVNATVGGIASGTQSINGYISVSGAASFPISNAQPVVGFVQPSLSATPKGANNFHQCNTQKEISTNTFLNFTELFGTAFKTRVAAQHDVKGAGQSIPPDAPALWNQSTPGSIYNSESNFVYHEFTGANGAIAGLADFGTRLKASFSNVPTGVQVFVSSANAAAPPVPGGSAANTAVGNNTYTGSYAEIVTGGESSSDGTAWAPVGYGAGDTTEVTIVNGSGVAVWEVVNTDPNAVETFSFQVFIAYTAHTDTNAPAPGDAFVTLSYAPTAASLPNSPTAGVPIPRFIVNSAVPATFFTVTVCRTILLFPYINNSGGLDTGLAIANTTQDPMAWGTTAQKGKCVLTFYGTSGAVPAAPYDTSTDTAYTAGIQGGSFWQNTLSTIAPGFTGYAFAVCNFQLAHGFAFLSDLGLRNYAMGYLALVIPDVGSRDPSPFGLGKGPVGSGEQEAH